MTPIERQLAELQEAVDGVQTRRLPNGTILVSIGPITLPPGWSREKTIIKFVIPTGYPFATPDCFWTNKELRLASGQMPQATRNQPIPDANESGLWFSWHVKSWNPSRDNLMTYWKVIQKRLTDAH